MEKKPLSEFFKNTGDKTDSFSEVLEKVGESFASIKKSFKSLLLVTKKELELDKKERKLEDDSIRRKKERSKRFSLGITKKLKEIKDSAAKGIKDAIGNILKIFAVYKFFELVKLIHENWKKISEWWEGVTDAFKKFADDVNHVVKQFTEAYDEVYDFIKDAIDNVRRFFGGGKKEEEKTEETTTEENKTEENKTQETTQQSSGASSSTTTPAQPKPAAPVKTNSSATPGKTLPKFTNEDSQRFLDSAEKGGFRFGPFDTRSPIRALEASYKEWKAYDEQAKEQKGKTDVIFNLKYHQAKKDLEDKLKKVKDLKLKYPKETLDNTIKANPEKAGFFNMLRTVIIESQPLERKQDGGKIQDIFSPGGGPILSGMPSGDTVPALLEKGEYVLNRNAVNLIGVDKLNEINFKAASRFQKGGVVGYVGSTGRSTGPHIHIEGSDKKDFNVKSLDRYINVGGKSMTSWGIRSGYGPRVNPVTGREGFHYGYDITGAGDINRQPITLKNGAKLVGKTPDDGGGYGNYIRIQVPSGKIYLLGHLSRFGDGKPESPTAGASQEGNDDGTQEDHPERALSDSGTGLMGDLWKKITEVLSSGGLDLGAVANAFDVSALTGENSPLAPIMNIFNGGLFGDSESKTGDTAKPGTSTTAPSSKPSASTPKPGVKPAKAGKLDPKKKIANITQNAKPNIPGLPKSLSDVLKPATGVSETGGIISALPEVLSNVISPLAGIAQATGAVPGYGDGDSVAALLEPGEFVLNRGATAAVGLERLNDLNRSFSDRSERTNVIASLSNALDGSDGVNIQTLPMPNMGGAPSGSRNATVTSPASERPLPNLSAYPPSRVMQVMAFRVPGSTMELVG